jgi:hypothetical protein
MDKILEIRSARGELLAIVQVKEIKAEEAKPQGTKKENEKTEEPNNKDSESLMTDPQKRYLFRLLAEQGIENDAAYEHLKKRFKVKTLKEVSRAAASQEIERILAEQKGGEAYAH